MIEFVSMGEMTEENGKTIRENNMEKQHNIPIGSLVEVKYDEWYGEGGCSKVHARLWVVGHDRDCDGTPLYNLSSREPKAFLKGGKVEFFEEGCQYTMPSDVSNNIINKVRTGFAEESLTPIEVTPDLQHGHYALSWEDD